MVGKTCLAPTKPTSTPEGPAKNWGPKASPLLPHCSGLGLHTQSLWLFFQHLHE